jgi:N-acetylglutamate synthase-like GNAT family acetyltransferase
VTIRRGERDDLALIAGFYRTVGYGGTPGAGDQIFLVEDGREMVGAVRLVQEQGVTVLRGMRIASSHQRSGLGTRLLRALADSLGERPCYCIPYLHLVGFYATVGFGEIDPKKAPPFLQARLSQYRRTRPESFTLMYRPGGITTAGSENGT